MLLRTDPVGCVKESKFRIRHLLLNQSVFSIRPYLPVPPLGITSRLSGS